MPCCSAPCYVCLVSDERERTGQATAFNTKVGWGLRGCVDESKQANVCACCVLITVIGIESAHGVVAVIWRARCCLVSLTSLPCSGRCLPARAAPAHPSPRRPFFLTKTVGPSRRHAELPTPSHCKSRDTQCLTWKQESTPDFN